MLALVPVLVMRGAIAGSSAPPRFTRIVAQGARADIGPTAVMMKLHTGTATVEKQRDIKSKLQELARGMGANLDIMLGCILAIASHYTGPPPEDVMRALIAEVGDTCTAATLQIGVEQLLQWAPGAPCCRNVQTSGLQQRHVTP